MTPQAWVTLMVGLAAILTQVITAFIIVRIAQAVLEQKVISLGERVNLADQEIRRLRDWRHDVAAQMLTTHELRLDNLERERED